jgi:uncharacterized protein (DUF2336 family)
MIAQKLPEIFSLARERSESARMRLAGLLADVFLENDTLNSREQLLVNEIIDELVGNTSQQIKQLLAEKLAQSETAPHRVLMNLASDDAIGVAAPILKTNAQLRDEDLIYVVEAHGNDHAMAIAERKAISEAVVDALVATGEVSVMATVAENLGAKISARALHAMVDAARFGKRLHEPLARRPELTCDMGLKMVWWIDTELRRQVVKRYGIGQGQIETALEDAIGEMLASIDHNRADAQAMAKVVAWLEERNALNAKVMIQILRMGLFRLYSLVLGRRNLLDSELVELIVSEDGGRSMSVLCRAIDVDKPSFVSMFLLSRGCRPGEQIVNPKELSQALSSFDKLDVATARDLIEGWRRDPSYLLNRFKQAIH